MTFWASARIAVAFGLASASAAGTLAAQPRRDAPPAMLPSEWWSDEAGPSAQTAGVLADARALAVDGQTDEAIALLTSRLDAFPGDVDARLLLGIMLSWQGEYDRARDALEEVVRMAPRYTDAISALYNVELWSGHPRAAKAVADMGLRIAPNDNGFLQRRRRAVDAIDRLRRWEVTGGYSYDWFSDRRAPWRERSASVKYATPVGSLIVGGTRGERFSQSDNQFEVQIYPRIGSNTSAYVAYAYAPNAQLYPKYRYAADVYQSLGAGFEGSVGFRRLGFAAITDVYVAGLNKYVGNWLFSGRMFYVPTAKSFHGSFRRFFGADGTSYVGARYSRGFTREEVRSLNDFEVLNADTVAAELQSNLGNRWRLLMSAASSRESRLDRGNLRQHSLAATLGFRF